MAIFGYFEPFLGIFEISDIFSRFDDLRDACHTTNNINFPATKLLQQKVPTTWVSKPR